MADTVKSTQEPQDLFTLGGDEVQRQNRELTIARRNFTERVEMAIARTDPRSPKKDEKFEYRTKKAKLNALNDILKDPESWKHDSTMCMQVFSACRDLGLSDKMIEVYKNAENEVFRSAPMVREQLAGAYVQRARTKDRSSSEKEK